VDDKWIIESVDFIVEQPNRFDFSKSCIDSNWATATVDDQFSSMGQ
jgi:hypothetical protein